MSDGKPPSLRNFDYFANDARPANVAELEHRVNVPRSLEEQLIAYRQTRQRHNRVVVLGLIAFAAAVWLLSSYRDEMAFTFFGPRESLDVGDVTRMRPSELKHNAYVTLQGITEHRGLRQKLVRGLSFSRQEYWYFRLLGSRGVFIEVAPDAQRYGFATAVRVTGRVVDPERDTKYRRLLSTYDSRYFPTERPTQRVIQVGMQPGEGMWPYLLALAFLAVLLAANIWAVVRILRGRSDAARRGLLPSR